MARSAPYAQRFKKKFYEQQTGCYMEVANFGGNANNGSDAGPWNWNLNNDSGNANQNIAARVKFLKIIPYSSLTSW